MLTLLQHTIPVKQHPFASLEALLDEPLPQSPEAMWHLEQRLAQARQQRPVALVHKGLHTTCVLLVGGPRIVIDTPSLRADRRRWRGRQRRARGARGAGGDPVLEALGIAERVSPATRGESALHVVQAARSCAAAQMLARRGVACAVSGLVRLRTAPAEASTRRREATLEAALRRPVPTNGPLAGQWVRVRLDGGRVRTRRRHCGRKTRKGWHGFSTPWREPRVLIIDILDEQGQPARLRVPRDDVLIGDAEAIWALRIGSVRRLGAAHADVVECIAEGAAWMWKRVERLRTLAEMPASKRVEVLDFSHASPYLAATIATCRSLSKAPRQALSKRLRHALRPRRMGWRA